MLRKTIKYAAIIFAVAVSLVSCQKDDSNEQVAKAVGTGFSTEINAEMNFKIQKAVYTRPGVVYFMDGSGTPIAVPTIKMRNPTTTICQEWLGENLNSEAVQGYISNPNDPGNVNKTGLYYDWNVEIASLEDGLSGPLGYGWNEMMYEEATGTINCVGFHLPKGNSYPATGDFEKLAQMLGSTSAIRAKLNIPYGTDYTTPWNPSVAGVWIDVRNTPGAPNIVPGCGVVALWKAWESDRFYYSFTNINNYHANVRLVRNISRAQWDK